MPKHDRSGFSSRAALAGGGVLIACGAGPAIAADWNVNPKVTASYEYNDNSRLTEVPGDEIAVSGGAIDAALELRADGPKGFFRLYPRLRSTFYPGDETEETDSQWVNMALRSNGERSQFDVRADYSRIETLGAFLPGGIGDPGGPIGEPDPGEETGSDGPNRQDRFVIAPEFSFDFSERHGMQAGGGYVDSTFDQRVDADREDYTYLYGTLGYVYRLSPSKSLTFGVEGARFEDEDGLTTGARKIAIEYRNKTSETAEFYARLGANQSEDDALVTDPDWETGFSGGIGVSWSFEVSKVLVDLTSDLDPNAAGSLVQRDSFRLQFNRRLSPKLDFVTGARLIHDSGAGDDDVFEKREYANAMIGLAWRFSQQWTLGGSYTYVWRDFEDDPTSAEANRLSIGITYEPNRL